MYMKQGQGDGGSPRQAEGSSSDQKPKFVTSGQWPTKAAYPTTTPEQLANGTPKLKADVSYLLLHDVASTKQQDDKAKLIDSLEHLC